MSIRKTRQEFEAHFSKSFPHLSQHRDENGDYSDFFADGAWCGWQEQQARIDQLEKELVEAKMDAKSARAHLAWIAKNIQRPCYRHICDRNGIAEDALAILKRKRAPDDDELSALSAIDTAMEAK